MKRYSSKNEVEYNCWCNIKQRCYNKNNASWNIYGGKGITVCDRWLESFDNFLEDMGQKPSKEYSIDRIDGNKGYYKDNCRWATPMQQGGNTSKIRWLEWNGKKQSCTAWARELGISRCVIKYRLRLGWTDVEKILTHPVGIRTEETKQKMKEMHTGSKNPFYGKKHTTETLKVISESTRLRHQKRREMQE